MHGVKDIKPTKRHLVVSVIGATAEIEESAREIAQIIGIINEMSLQTTLRALNVTLDADKGLAPAASRVRALARIAERVAQINRAISEIATPADDHGAASVHAAAPAEAQPPPQPGQRPTVYRDQAQPDQRHTGEGAGRQPLAQGHSSQAQRADRHQEGDQQQIAGADAL